MSVWQRHMCRVLVYCFFFFSSRRRHTRYIGDWSSDVCSSDLGGGSPRGGRGGRLWVGAGAAVCPAPAGTAGGRGADPGPGRSEERRVGKECRSRWSPDQATKKVQGKKKYE